MNTNNHAQRLLARTLCTFSAAVFLVAVPFALQGCDKDVSTRKTTTTKTTETPEGVKKTTETTEKKVETEHKNPN